MLGEHFQQREFSGGQRDPGAGFGQAAGAEVEPEVPELDGLIRVAGCARRCRRWLPAQHGLDACHQFARIEGFGHVVIGSDLESDDAVNVVTLGCEHDDGHRFATAAQPPADRQSIFSGQHQVKDHQFKTLARELAIHLRGISNDAHDVTLLGKVAVEEVAQSCVIVNHQDPGLGLCHVPIVPSSAWPSHAFETIAYK